MNAQKDQIQALIAEIDGVLQRTTPRLPWVVSGDAAQQRQLLERVRNYLVASQRQLAAGDGPRPTAPSSGLFNHDGSYPVPPNTASVSGSEPTMQMMQMLLQEMSYLRTQVMQPLQSDLDLLRQQRDALAQEVRQLEAQRQNLRLGQSTAGQQQVIGEFLQVLMGRLQETLAQQMAQTLNVIRSQALPSNPQSLLAGESAYHPPLDQIQALQARSDQMLVNLDTTLQVVFESLQQNIQVYQDSLAQGVDRMHHLGQQSEVLFAALVNQLTQQVGQSGPSLPASAQQPLANPPTHADASVTSVLLQSQETPLPYAGAEVFHPPSSHDSQVSYGKKSGSEDALPSEETKVDWGTEDKLNLSDLQLQPFVNDVDSLIDLEETLGSLAQDQDTTTEAAAMSSNRRAGATDTSNADTGDIDAALKLLEQFSQDLREPSITDTPISAGPSLIETDAIAVVPEDSNPLDGIPDELDELYLSLFGDTTTTTPAASTGDQPEPGLLDGTVNIPHEVESLDPGLASPLSASSFETVFLGQEGDSDEQSDESSEPLSSQTAIWKVEYETPDPTVDTASLISEEVDLDDVLGDQFIPASFEEDLMPMAPAQNETSEIEFALDASILSRLNEDLFNLEIASDDPMVSFEPDELRTQHLSSELSSNSWETSDNSLSSSTSEMSGGQEEESLNNLSLVDFSEDINAPILPSGLISNHEEAPSFALPESLGDGSIESPFTLEGMDDLFADETTSDETTSTGESIPPVSQTTSVPTQPGISLTLEGIQELFSDSEPVSRNFSGEVGKTDNSSQAIPKPPLTLERMEEMFSYPPVTSHGSTEEVESNEEGLGNTIATQPTIVTPVESDASMMTLEGIDDWFADATPIKSSAANQELQNQDDVSPRSVQPSEEMTLEEAFESLIGMSPIFTPATSDDPSTAPSSTKQVPPQELFGQE